MKNLFLILFTVVSAQPALAGVKKTIKMSWSDESKFVETYDTGIYTFVLPMTKRISPKVKLTDNYALGECEIVSEKITAKNYIVKIELIDFERDDGFNGCQIDFSRNHPNDEDGSGNVLVDLGFHIDG